MGNCSCSKKDNMEKEKIVMACSGGSNVGQISNAVMVKLKMENMVRPYCLAGIGADLPAFITTSKDSETIVIDGCSVGCAKKIFIKNNISPTHYFIVNEMGIEKSYDYNNIENDTITIKEKIVLQINKKEV